MLFDWFIEFHKLDQAAARKAETERGQGLLASLFGRRR